jgi:hypothetical protein
VQFTLYCKVNYSKLQHACQEKNEKIAKKSSLQNKSLKRKPKTKLPVFSNGKKSRENIT